MGGLLWVGFFFFLFLIVSLCIFCQEDDTCSTLSPSPFGVVVCGAGAGGVSWLEGAFNIWVWKCRVRPPLAEQLLALTALLLRATSCTLQQPSFSMSVSQVSVTMALLAVRDTLYSASFPKGSSHYCQCWWQIQRVGINFKIHLQQSRWGKR